MEWQGKELSDQNGVCGKKACVKKHAKEKEKEKEKEK